MVRSQEKSRSAVCCHGDQCGLCCCWLCSSKLHNHHLPYHDVARFNQHTRTFSRIYSVNKFVRKLYLKFSLQYYYYYYYYYYHHHLTAIGLAPSGSSAVHINTQTLHRIQRTEHSNNKKKKLGSKFGSAGLAPFLRIIPWNLAYN
jgi:hypothetical protein